MAFSFMITKILDDAMEYLIVLLVLIFTASAALFVKYRWSERKNRAVYVCDLCDENHCECIRE